MANPFLTPPTDQPRTNPFLQPAAPRANPFLAEGWDARTGFQRHVTDRLMTGVEGLKEIGASIVAKSQAEDLATLDKIDELLAPAKRVDETVRTSEQGFDEALRLARQSVTPEISEYVKAAPERRAEIRAKMQAGVGAGVSGIMEAREAAAAIPKNPALIEAMKTGSSWEVFKTVLANPSIITDVALESAPQMAAGMVAAPVVGPAAAMGASSLATEAGQEFTDALQRAGVNVEDQAAFEAAMADPKIVEAAKIEALKKGIPVALLDAISGKLASKSLVGGTGLKAEAKNVAAQMPIQAGLGAEGEALGQMVQSGGRITDPAAIALEAIGEFGGAPLEVAGLSIGRLASPDVGAPLSEAATLNLLRGGNAQVTNPPPVSTPEPPQADQGVQVAKEAGQTSREEGGVKTGINLPSRPSLDTLPKRASEILPEEGPEEAVKQVKLAIAKRNAAAKSKGEGATRLRREAEQHLDKAVEGGWAPQERAEQSQPQSPQQVAEQTPNSPPINVLPPAKRPMSLYRGHGRTAQGAVYQQAATPILGPGQYYAFKAEDAQEFGPNIDTRTTDNLRPLVIRNDKQWRELTREAGWEFPNPTGQSLAEVKAMTERLRALVQRKGFDSVAVQFDSEARTDYDLQTGESHKLLRTVFGTAQVVVYDNAPEVQHVDIPEGAKTSLSGSQFFNLGSFSSKTLRADHPEYDAAAHKPNEVIVLTEPGAMMAEVNKITPFLREFTRKFLNGAKVVLTTKQSGFLGKNAKDKGFLGQFYGTVDGTVVIWVDPRAFSADNAFQSVQVLAHEFGHAVAWWNWYNTPSDTQQAIMAEYQDYLIRSAGMRPEEAIAETQSAWALSSLAIDADVNERILKGESIDAHAERIKSWFDFDEWMAEQFVRWATTDKKPLTIVEKYFKSVADKIKNVFRFFGLDVKGSLAAPVMTAWFRSIQERNEAMMPSSTPFAMLHSQLKGMQQIRDELDEDWGVDGPTVSPATTGLRRLFRAMNVPPAQAAAVDKFDWWINKMWGLLQIADKNPHIQGLRDFVEGVRNFHISKMALISRADGRLREWRKLGKDMSEKLSAFLFDVDSMSYLAQGQNARWPTNQELVALAQRHGLNQEALQLYMDIKGDFAHVLDKMQAAWLRDAQASITDPAQLWNAIQAINTEMGALRSRPYFPHERFGDWTLTARDAAGKTVFFQQFANRRTAQQAAEQYARSNPGQAVSTGRMPREVAQFRGLPPTLMRSVAARLNLTAVQQRMLDDLILDLSPANSAAKRFKKRKGTQGYSLDGMRAYANYFLTMSGWLARLEHSGTMQEGIKNVQQSAMAMRGIYAADAMHKRLGIAEWMQRTFDYLNDGKSEWQGMRSFAFLWYLGYNISSALVNMTQVPMVALPYLSGRFNDVVAINELRKAYSNVRGNYLMRPSGHTPELQQALEEATKQGFIDESMAAELASASSGGTLEAMLPGTKLQRGLMTFANVGAIPFKMVEKLNRRVVFQAAFRLAQKNPNKAFLTELEAVNPDLMGKLRAQGWTDTNARAFLAARDAIEKSQFEYTRWARPEFMRGKKSILFTFFMFKQNMLWFLRHGPGAGRAWVMMLAAAGIMGLPGADHLDDLVKFLTRHIGGKYFNPQVELRKLLVEQLSIDPDLVMHGLGYHTLGLTAVGNALGIPVPDIDLSSRMGMGQLVPGIEPLLAINRDSFDERFGKSAEQILGAGINVPLGILKAVTSGDPNKFKQIERGLPTAWKNLATAYRWLDKGVETTRSGAETAEFDIMDSRGRMDIFAKALGFNPTYLAAKRELTSQQMEAAAYWGLRRTELFEQFAFARISKDKEGLRDVQEAIREYNRTAPNGKLKITMEDLRNNLKSRLKKNAKIEAGAPPTQGLGPVYRELEGLYPSSERK